MSSQRPATITTVPRSRGVERPQAFWACAVSPGPDRPPPPAEPAPLPGPGRCSPLRWALRHRSRSRGSRDSTAGTCAPPLCPPRTKRRARASPPLLQPLRTETHRDTAVVGPGAWRGHPGAAHRPEALRSLPPAALPLHSQGPNPFARRVTPGLLFRFLWRLPWLLTHPSSLSAVTCLVSGSHGIKAPGHRQRQPQEMA